MSVVTRLVVDILFLARYWAATHCVSTMFVGT